MSAGYVVRAVWLTLVVLVWSQPDSVSGFPIEDTALVQPNGWDDVLPFFRNSFCVKISMITHSLTQSLDLWGRRGDMRAEESVFCRHASLSEADLTSSYIAIPDHSWMVSHQAFFCRLRLRLPSTAP
ncbi:hypothetical protein ElyMa_006388300 [Elysia marginata]|uniref:Uncharacterized protein n=1 Tax=Elysia marginata TaxID=1093978 RepID=A0AAV4HTK4_9GAST|nr:hypothetical protein ElyMa_006388300 [Elysia marginata]